MGDMTLRQYLEAIRDIPLNLRDDIARERAFDYALAALKSFDRCPTYDDIVFYDDTTEFLSNTPVRARMIPDPTP